MSEGKLYSDTDLDNLFDYHRPSSDQQEKYAKLNQAAKEYAKIIIECCPQSEDRDLAIQKLRETRMQSNLSIACSG